MPDVGGFVGEDMAQAFLRLHRRRCEINGRAKQPEQAGGGEARFHQIGRMLAAVNSVWRSHFAEFSPEAQVGEKKGQRRHYHAGNPDQMQKLCGGEALNRRLK